MSDFDSLQSGSFLHIYRREGCETRLRPEPGAERDDMDAKVLAVGGDWVAVPTPRSEPASRRRMYRSAQPQQYVYRIPTHALS